MSDSVWLPRRRAGISAENFGPDTLIMPSDSDRVHFLNETAQHVWTLCDGTHTPDAMAAALRERFAVGEGVDVSADVRTILAALAAARLLEPAA
jgi:hypothetical protein